MGLSFFQVHSFTIVIALEALKALSAFTLCLLVSSTSSVQILCRTLSDLSMPFTERLRAPADHG